MKTNKKSVSGGFAAWVLVAGMLLAVPHGPNAVDADADADTDADTTTNVVGGRVSRVCHAGLWLVRHGHLISGGGLIWLGC